MNKLCFFRLGKTDLFIFLSVIAIFHFLKADAEGKRTNCFLWHDRKKIMSLNSRKKDSNFIVAFKDKENKTLGQATGF